MASPVPMDVTQLLVAWSQGDEGALGKLVPLVYRELRRLAHRYMRKERAGHALQTTALVHEAYERLVDTPHVRWQDRSHFFAVCAQLMRRILVDYARAQQYQKRGAGAPLTSLDPARVRWERSRDLVALDEALGALAAIDPRKAQVVELRFFGGLTADETAHVLKVSPDTVLRDWKVAKVWLLRELGGGNRDG
jgi:RNA polymerase sigma-70 factor (ECF subfamily)